MNEKYEDEVKPEMSWNLISRRDLLKKGVAFSAILPLLTVLGTEEVFAAEKEHSGSRIPSGFSGINFGGDTQDILASCTDPSSPNSPPNGCSLCANALGTDIPNYSDLLKFFSNVHAADVEISDLSKIAVPSAAMGPTSDCGDAVSKGKGAIQKDEYGNIVYNSSTGYCNLPASVFMNNETYRVQWIVASFLQCAYGSYLNMFSAMWLAWFMVGKPVYPTHYAG